MAVARHGSGVTAAGRALASQVHPVFMLPPVATAAFGALLAPSVTALPAGLHLVAIFCAVYTAHVKDGYVDFHVRGEDADHPLTVYGCGVGMVAASLGFVVAVGGLFVTAGVLAAAVTVPTWVIGYLHAPQLDSTTVGATLGYPVGVALALTGGYITQTGGLDVLPLSLALVFLVLLAGVKIVDDAADYDYDVGVGKPTVAVVVGPTRARWIAEGCMATAVVAVVGLAAIEVVPPTSVGAGFLFVVVAGVAHRRGAAVATMLLVRGAYVFLAGLIVALWLHPLS